MASDALIAFSGTLVAGIITARLEISRRLPFRDKTAFRSRLYQFPKNHKLVTGERATRTEI